MELIQLEVSIADASHLPVYHVNALNLRFSIDEFFFTLGVGIPPTPEELDNTEDKRVIAHPVFRFAITPNIMERFLEVMAMQYGEHERMIRKTALKEPSEDREPSTSIGMD